MTGFHHLWRLVEKAHRNPTQYPFVHLLADQVRTREERETFLEDPDLILLGAEARAAA